VKISISNLAWAPSENTAVLALLRKHEIAAIDVVPNKCFSNLETVDANEISLVRKWWNDAGVRIVGMQSLLYGTAGLNLFGEQETRERMLSHLSRICRIAGGLGEGVCMVFGSPRNRNRAGLEKARALEMAVAFFQKLALVAGDRDVKICLEPNPVEYNSNFMTTADETAEVVSRVGHPSVRMQLDTGAIRLNKENVREILAKHAEHIGHVHVSEPYLAPIETEQGEHQKMGREIKEVLPRCYACVEMAQVGERGSLDVIDNALAVAVACYGDSF
jgi:sugar phosphate isomerase/epimerase